MLKFFRKIRQSLVAENKVSRYFLYAIGEIILVVIGILIALQINNWNQDRLDLKEKRNLLEKVQLEFRANKVLIADHKAACQQTMKNLNSLLELVGSKRETLEAYNLDSLFYNSFQGEELGLSDNSINSIIQSGQLRLFKNEPITTLFQQWNALSSIRVRREEKLDYWTNNHFIPFLLSFISFKEMDSNAGYFWSGNSNLKPDYYLLFQKIEFENLLDNTLWMNQQVLLRLEESEALIEEIIRETEIR
ncbi:hypothetical protein SAMN06265375_10553 [Muriicola jejuensis]|uniref:Uncharacterized protein n=1 Tax=Muriicola jejuensis TaxID=504488 RepID=A0A6P0UIQ7_9FLAO|nr:DUF6090 family protein [Muriicola jejuensis]NER11699.1 hypothetical protein [Muriicola jejuensis]SMP25406.1 hypothetical protein SAMN06265375_10553 [Muriicola jejuensis]